MKQIAPRELDRRVYEEEIAPRLPERIIDCHVHIALREHMGEVSPERIAANWALEVGVEQSWESMRDVFSALFQRQEVGALAFGAVFQETDIEANNDYVLSGSLDSVNKSKALMVTRPEWGAELVEKGLARGFIGIKPYPDLAPADATGPSIYDFMPRSHLATLDKAGGILVLHLPRKGRLGDPDNICELLEISENYPSIKIIVAHIGRSFCLPTAQKGLPHFTSTKNIYFDTSANLNSDVFQYAIETLGPERLLYGSDLPITLMRGVREHVGEQYINYTDEPYSWNKNRKLPDEEAKYTYFLYEELRAIFDSVDRAGLGEDALDKIFYSNIMQLLAGRTL